MEKELVKRIAELLEKSVKDLVYGKEVSIAFSGGIDSTTLAFLSKRYAKSVSLYSCGFPESKDIYYSIKVAEKLELPLNIYFLDKQEAKELYEKVENLFHLGFLKSEILALIQKIFEVAPSPILFGSGSEELFVGYDRYYQGYDEGKDVAELLKEEFNYLISKGDVYYIKKLAEYNKKEALFPFCNKELANLLLNSPVELRFKDREKKKYLLREAAKLLGVPSISIERRKQALQYGSGIHKRLLKMKKRKEIG